MCVGCMRNWQYNPVKCHSCDQAKIQSPVGDGWGALLIAGTDEDPNVTEQFEKDITEMNDKVITEVTVMGVSKENVITVKKSTTNYKKQLDKAFNNIREKEISTLVLVYSGHHSDAGFWLDSENIITDYDLKRNLNELNHVEKIILVFDCCFPKRLNLSDKTYLQLNAVNSSESASCDTEGSQFINEIVLALTEPWTYTCYKNTSILKHSELQDHLSRHLNRPDSTNPSEQTDTRREIDRILAFRPVGSGWQDAFEKNIRESSLIVLKTRLIKNILHYYSTLPLNPIVKKQDLKLVDFYEPPHMSKTVQETEDKDKRDEDSKTCKPGKEPKWVQKSLSKIEELFSSNQCKDDKNPSYTNRVYISGEAGTGKTSFSQYLALAWCAVHGEGEVCVKMREKMKKFEVFNDIEYLKQTKLLFLLHLREFENEDNCKTMLKTYLQSDLGYLDSDINDLLSYINSPQTILLMDGLDEWKCNANKMPKDTSVFEARIICSSRPWKIDSCITAPMQDYNKITMNGIGFDFVKRLVGNVIKCLRQEGFPERDDTADFIQILGSEQLKTIIHHYASASGETLLLEPGVLLPLLCLWYEGKDFGKTRTQVYMNMSDTLLQVMEKKHDQKYVDTADKPQLQVYTTMRVECLKKHSENIAKLSKLAFYLLFTGPMEHSLQFSKIGNQELEKTFEEIKQFCLDSGLIQGTSRKCISRPDEIYSFIHKTYQEFFAALHIVARKCDTSICQEIMKNTKTIQNVIELANVFDFVCGFDSTCIEAMVSLIENLTKKHVMITDDEKRIRLIKTIQNMILESCYKNVNEGKVSINLSNLIVRDLFLESPQVFSCENLTKLLRTKENKLETDHLEITLNKKLGVLYLENINLTSSMDISQFDMEELIMLHVCTEFVNLSKIKRLQRLVLNSQNSVSVSFEYAENLRYLKLSNCILSGPMDLSQCPIECLDLSKVDTKRLIVGCVEECTLKDIHCLTKFTNVSKLTQLNMSFCSPSCPLDISQSALKRLELSNVEIKSVIVDCVEECTLVDMSCLIQIANFSKLTDLNISSCSCITHFCMQLGNAHALKNLKMVDCSYSDPLDLSECPLDELDLKNVKTEKVIVGCVRTCIFKNMSCFFLFKDANTLTDLRFNDCVLTQPVTLCKCPLESLELVKVDISMFEFGSLETLTKLRISDCRFFSALPSSASNLVHVILEHCEVPKSIHCQSLTTLEITETCGLRSYIELSQTSLEHLILNETDISLSQFMEQIEHLYNLPRQVQCTVKGSIIYWMEISNARQLMMAIVNMMDDARFTHTGGGGQRNMRFTIITRH